MVPLSWFSPSSLKITHPVGLSGPEKRETQNHPSGVQLRQLGQFADRGRNLAFKLIRMHVTATNQSNVMVASVKKESIQSYRLSSLTNPLTSFGILPPEIAHLNNDACTCRYTCLAPHRTAPHCTASHRIRAHRTAPHRTAPHRTAPQRTASHRTSRIASHQKHFGPETTFRFAPKACLKPSKSTM